jgi:hypothetical protein
LSTYLVKFLSERKVLREEVGKETETYFTTHTSLNVCNLLGNSANINVTLLYYYWPM